MIFGPFIIPEQNVIYKTKYSYVFTNLRPAAEGHILVSPKRKVQFFNDLTNEEKVDLLQLTEKSAKIMQKKLNTKAIAVTTQDGPSAGQTVPHVHFHVIPRNIPTQWLHSSNQPPDVQAHTTSVYRQYFEEELPNLE